MSTVQHVTVVLRPGDPLPRGRYVNAWLLSPPDYPKWTLNLTYEPVIERTVAAAIVLAAAERLRRLAGGADA